MSPRRAGHRSRFAALSIAVFAALALAGCGSESDERDAALNDDGGSGLRVPGFEGELEPDLAAKGKVEISDSTLEEAAESIEEGEVPPPEVTQRGERVVVEVIVRDGALAPVREEIEGLGGTVNGSVPPTLLQALVPADRLAQVEARPGVEYVRVPVDQSLPLAEDAGQATIGGLRGEEIAKTGALAWHAAGQLGAGVKVGIIDNFDPTLWNAAMSAGEVPRPAGGICREEGRPCDLWSAGAGSKHGIGVAEVIHEMAPEASIYLASATTAADHQAVVNYFASQGVKVISRSQGGRYDGPGNGTGESANVLNSAVAQGMIWVNSAGNAAGRNGHTGGYWRGAWNPWLGTDGVEYQRFGAYAALPFSCSYVYGLRWNDWDKAVKTDYDLYVGYIDGNGVWQELSSSLNSQLAGYAPIERVDDLSCPPGVDQLLAYVALDPRSGDTAGDVLEFQVHDSIGYNLHVNPGSAGQPFSDSASPGAISVGAVDPAMGTAIASYSSEGPTNDGRVKPDLSAASCVKSYAYAPGCFNGTSAAAPTVSGAAALVLGAGLAANPAALKSYLVGATVDRGAAGPDNVYGSGELLLPPPPAAAAAAARPTPAGSSRCPQARRAEAQAGKRLAKAQRRLKRARGAEQRRAARRQLRRARGARVNAAAARIGACGAQRNRKR